MGLVVVIVPILTELITLCGVVVSHKLGNASVLKSPNSGICLQSIICMLINGLHTNHLSSRMFAVS